MRRERIDGAIDHCQLLAYFYYKFLIVGQLYNEYEHVNKFREQWNNSTCIKDVQR